MIIIFCNIKNNESSLCMHVDKYNTNVVGGVSLYKLMINLRFGSVPKYLYYWGTPNKISLDLVSLLLVEYRYLDKKLTIILQGIDH